MDKVAVAVIAVSICVFSFPALEPFANRMSLNAPPTVQEATPVRANNTPIYFFGSSKSEVAEDAVHLQGGGTTVPAV